MQWLKRSRTGATISAWRCLFQESIRVAWRLTKSGDMELLRLARSFFASLSIHRLSLGSIDAESGLSDIFASGTWRLLRSVAAVSDWDFVSWSLWLSGATRLKIQCAAGNSQRHSRLLSWEMS